MPDPLDQRLRARLDRRRAAGLERPLPQVGARQGLRYRLGDREVVGFCSNDYLGFGSEPVSLPRMEAGATASRLVAGDLPVHRELEARLAAWVGTEDAVLYPSGYQANVSALCVLIERQDRVHSDALNHASLIDGLRLARSRPRILHHLCPPEVKADADTGFDWWICEGAYSMEGDGPTIDDLDRHLERGGCLYFDEAHTLGLHERGRGRAMALRRTPHAILGTLGKAVGASGAFVAASRTVCEVLRTESRGFVFSTGTSPTQIATIHDRLHRVLGPEGERRRERLWENVELFAELLDVPPPRLAPIFPLHVGDNRRATDLSANLLDLGYHVQAIRPPTVPEGSARLRVTLAATHDPADIRALAEHLRRTMTQPSRAPTST